MQNWITLKADGRIHIMKDEKKVLGILAIVFGGISLTISWVPILNNVSFYIAVISLILGVIALIVNRKIK